jgi:hypothetical protein
MLRNRLIVIALTLLPAGLHAQVNVERFAQTDFNFDPPGARSLGVGGAFVSIADDATAVESNPAGLTILLYPEASFEFKGVQYTRKVNEGTSAERSFDKSSVFPSFASLVYPIGNLRLAASYSKIVDTGGDLASNGVTLSGGHLFPWFSTMDWNVSNLGIGAAMKFGQGFSIGASGGLSMMNMSLDHTRYFVNSNNPGFVANRSFVDADESAPYINVGGILRLDNFSAGVTYKKRPRFEDIPISFTDVYGKPFEGADESFTIKLPDAIGGGLSVKTANDRLTLSFAAEQLKYSQLTENMAIVVSPDEVSSTDYKADDGIDYRAGIEWIAFLGSTPYAIRLGGASLAPSNIYFTGSDSFTKGLWPSGPRDRKTEFSGGIGASFGFVSIDIAGAVSNTRKEFVTSFVIRQPK